MRLLISVLITGWLALLPAASAQEKTTVIEVGL